MALGSDDRRVSKSQKVKSMQCLQKLAWHKNSAKNNKVQSSEVNQDWAYHNVYTIDLYKHVFILNLWDTLRANSLQTLLYLEGIL